MNQILVSKKLYVTPELRKRKKIYKVDFIISIFLVIVLFSAYIYAEYDRTKSEEVSQEILSDIDFSVEETTTDNTTISVKDNILMVVLDGNTVGQQEEVNLDDLLSKSTSSGATAVYTAPSGVQYTYVAVVNIPKIGVNYPVLLETPGETLEALLKVSTCKFWGGDPNEIGNFCIVGHNYRNKRFFSKVPTLVAGDIVQLTDISGRTLDYVVYDKYTVVPEDVSCTSQRTNGKREVTLITCTDDSKERVVVKCRAV